MCALRQQQDKTRMRTYPLVSLLLDAERPVFASVTIVADGGAGIGRHLGLPLHLHRSPSRHCCGRLNEEMKPSPDELENFEENEKPQKQRKR